MHILVLYTAFTTDGLCGVHHSRIHLSERKLEKLRTEGWIVSARDATNLECVVVLHENSSCMRGQFIPFFQI